MIFSQKKEAPQKLKVLTKAQTKLPKTLLPSSIIALDN